MTTKEAGKLLGGVSDSRVRQLIQEKRLVPEKFGHMNLIPREQVERLKTELEQPAPAGTRGRKPKVSTAKPTPNE
jgi:excisionase family DNA binding protein